MGRGRRPSETIIAPGFIPGKHDDPLGALLPTFGCDSAPRRGIAPEWGLGRAPAAFWPRDESRGYDCSAKRRRQSQICRAPDPYHWLEDPGSPETKSWLASENAYSSHHFAQLAGRESLAGRLGELMQIDLTSTPIEREGRYFFSKKAANEDLWSVYYRDGINSEDALLLDPYQFSDDKTAAVFLFGVSADGKFAAYGVRRSGQDEVEVRIRDVDDGEDIADRLPKGLYSGLSFTKDNKGFYYARRDRQNGSRIYRRQIGSDPSEDQVVFGEGYGPDVFLSLSVSDRGDYLLINAQHGWARNEVWVLKLSGQQPARPIVRDLEALFQPQWAGPNLLALQTGWNASNRRILLVDVEKPSEDQWREVVPESADAIQRFSVIDGKLFVGYLHNVATRIRIFTLEGEPAGEVRLPEISSGAISGRWNSRDAFLSFSSFADPGKVNLYDARTGEQKVWFEPRAPVDGQAFETKQVWYESKETSRSSSMIRRHYLTRSHWRTLPRST